MKALANKPTLKENENPNAYPKMTSESVMITNPGVDSDGNIITDKYGRCWISSKLLRGNPNPHLLDKGAVVKICVPAYDLRNMWRFERGQIVQVTGVVKRIIDNSKNWKDVYPDGSPETAKKNCFQVKEYHMLYNRETAGLKELTIIGSPITTYSVFDD